MKVDIRIGLKNLLPWTSINQFMATAVAEKVSALRAAEFFADRKARADFRAFDKIMRRRGGVRAGTGDELPDVKRHGRSIR